MRKFKLTLMTVAILLMSAKSPQAEALAGDPFEEPVKIRCTCYLDDGTTASGKQTREGIVASKREWIGYVAELNKVNDDGTIGELIGYYEILDTGYGRETGVGESQVLGGRTLGTIEAGETIDVWMPTSNQAEEWIDAYGDYVYIKIIKGKG